MTRLRECADRGCVLAGSVHSGVGWIQRHVRSEGLALEPFAAELPQQRVSAPDVPVEFQHIQAGCVPSLVRTGLLGGTREQAEFIAFGIGENHPRGVGTLPHIRAPCAQVKEPFELIACRLAVGAKVEMQSVLDCLVLWHWHHVDRGPGAIHRGDAYHAVVFFDDPPAEDGAPEVSDHTRLNSVDRDARYATGHAAILPALDADRGCDARPGDGRQTAAERASQRHANRNP